MDDCPLCLKIATPPTDQLVWRFPSSLAFLGPWQFHTGYCVLVSRTHAAELFQLSQNESTSFQEEMLVAKALSTTFSPRKMNYEMLGNQVVHPHWHLFPRRHDDPETLKAVWLGFERAENDSAEKSRLMAGPFSREETIARIRAELTRQGLSESTP